MYYELGSHPTPVREIIYEGCESVRVRGHICGDQKCSSRYDYLRANLKTMEKKKKREREIERKIDR